MYSPAYFREDRISVLHEFIRAHSLATLVSSGPSGIQASPVPLLLTGEGEILRGHVAKGNAHWKEMEGQEGLAIFTGDDYYVSPSLYPSKAEHGKVVPTWNYATVHVRGPLSVFHDPEWLRTFLQELTYEHESTRSEPWHVSDAPADYVERLLQGIVGFELRIEKLEGKFKQSQNRPEPDRSAVLGSRPIHPNRT